MPDAVNTAAAVTSITTPGANTSEGQAAASATMWGVVAMILGLLTTIGASIAESLGHDSKTAIIVGAVIAIAGKVQQTLVALGYIQARTQLKSDAADMVAAVASPAPVTVNMPAPAAAAPVAVPAVQAVVAPAAGVPMNAAQAAALQGLAATSPAG